MGLSKSLSSKSHYESSKTIVLLQWEGGPQNTPPKTQLWTLDCPPTHPQPKTLPTPSAVYDRFPEPGLEANQNAVRLPPRLAYSNGSSSILMYNPVVGENVDLEFTRWGPGLHLTQIQPLEKLFQGAPAGLSGAKHLSPIGLIRPDGSRDYGERGYAIISAIAMNDDDGRIDVKYRAETHTRDSFSPVDIQDSYKDKEQTIVTAIKPSASHVSSWPPEASSIPVHICAVGSRVRYLLLATLCQNRDKTKNILSLHRMDERMVFAETTSTKGANEDRGFRWQQQTFELPPHISNIAPIMVDVEYEKYLFVFYFDNGALCYARMKYAGSGSFVDFVSRTECFSTMTVVQPQAAPVYDSSGSTRSRWSLSSRLLLSSQEPESEPTQAETQREEPVGTPLPLAAEGCQPYPIITKGSIWIFYQGADMDAKYVRHRLSGGISDFSDGWESVSWATRQGPNETGKEKGWRAPSHFIPIVVPGEFMHMK